MSDFRILLASNDVDARYALALALAPRFELVETGDGAAALAKVESCEPDLVVIDTDLNMIDGFETCREIRRAGSEHAQIPVFMISRRDSRNDFKRGYEVGASLYMAKPVDAGRLLKNIDVTIQSEELHPRPKHYGIEALKARGEIATARRGVPERALPEAPVVVAPARSVPPPAGASGRSSEGDEARRRREAAKKSALESVATNWHDEMEEELHKQAVGSRADVYDVLGLESPAEPAGVRARGGNGGAYGGRVAPPADHQGSTTGFDFLDSPPPASPGPSRGEAAPAARAFPDDDEIDVPPRSESGFPPPGDDVDEPPARAPKIQARSFGDAPWESAPAPSREPPPRPASPDLDAEIDLPPPPAFRARPAPLVPDPPRRAPSGAISGEDDLAGGAPEYPSRPAARSTTPPPFRPRPTSAEPPVREPRSDDRSFAAPPPVQAPVEPPPRAAEPAVARGASSPAGDEPRRERPITLHDIMELDIPEGVVPVQSRSSPAAPPETAPPPGKRSMGLAELLGSPPKPATPTPGAAPAPGAPAKSPLEGLLKPRPSPLAGLGLPPLAKPGAVSSPDSGLSTKPATSTSPSSAASSAPAGPPPVAESPATSTSPKSAAPAPSASSPPAGGLKLPPPPGAAGARKPLNLRELLGEPGKGKISIPPPKVPAPSAKPPAQPPPAAD